MAEDPDALPLRDRIRNAEKLVRELADHLDNGYMSRVRELERMTSEDGKPTGDMTVRMGVKNLLDADAFAQDLWTRTRAYLQSISTGVREME